MKTKCILLYLVYLFAAHSLSAQWTLVWSDEFDGNSVNSNNWTFDIGTGSGGWGNNELEYYRSENATVSNGNLQITAKNESYGGMSYTSARLKTEGKISVGPYGKIEARILAPSFTGSWPAFWMLGDNFSSVGWPSCGEIDILEHVNTENVSHAAIHWLDHNNSQADYSGTVSNNVTSWHTYSLEWDQSYLRWFIDGSEFFVAEITDGTNGTDEFHNSFFIILNLAVGGNWPGFTVDASALPATMYVDYIRVYSADGQGTNNGGATSSCSGSETDYNWSISGSSIDFASKVGSTWADAHYTIDGGGQLNVRMNSIGNNSFNFPISVPEGSLVTVWYTYNKLDGLAYNSAVHLCTVGSSSTSDGLGGSNLVTVQAEDYTNMSGVQTENTFDVGGGINVGWIDAGDWMAYSGLEIQSAGNYRISYRVASPYSSGVLSADLNAGSTVLGTLNIPNTGGWQNWTTISHTVNLSAGIYDFGIYAAGGGWNINWWSIESVDGSSIIALKSSNRQINNGVRDRNESIYIYPNPVGDFLHIETKDDSETIRQIEIYNSIGQLIIQKQLDGDNATLNISDLQQGTYFLKAVNNKKVVKNVFFIK